MARLESGHTGFSINKICIIAEILDVPPLILLTPMPDYEILVPLTEFIEWMKEEGKELSDDEVIALFQHVGFAVVAGYRPSRIYFLNLLAALRSDVFASY